MSPRSQRRLRRSQSGRRAVLVAPGVGVIPNTEGGYVDVALLLAARTVAGAAYPGETVIRLPRSAARRRGAR